jgi:2-dehydropantoate 2-reductase
MKIAILGAGAMGTIFGAALTRAGHDVHLVDVSEDVVERLNARGTVVETDGADQTTMVPATTDPSSVGVAELVIFFVKGYQTAAAAELARPLVASHTAVVSLQNGWGNEALLAEVFGPAQIVAGVSYHSARADGPGRTSHSALGPTFLGSLEGGDVDYAERAAAVLTDTGWQVDVVADAATALWQKLVLNCVTLPVAALTRLTVGNLTAVDALMAAVAEETCAVGRATGRELDTAERLEVIRGAVARGGDGKGSMLQDVEAGRRTEIDTITGAVLGEAERVGVEAPLNRMLFDLVRGYEIANGLV